MGQYYLIVNADKREYLNPHKFGDGLKLMEFGCSANGTLTALTALLTDGNGRGSGDLHSNNPVVGSWAGDRIVIAGDYADPHNFVPDELEDELYENNLDSQLERDNIDRETAEEYAEKNCNLYQLAREFYDDVSERAKDAIRDDDYVAREMDRNIHISHKREARESANNLKFYLKSLEPQGKAEEISEKVDTLMDEIEELEDYEYDRYGS